MDENTILIPGFDKPVSRVALGTWAIGGWMWGGPDDDNAVRTIHRALDEGVDLIDTAPVYGFGHSEEIVGRALAEKPNNARIATKLALDWGEDHKPFRNSSPARIRKEVEDSLRRLRVDTIDLEQVHWPDPNTPIEDTANELQKLHKEGKIRALGVSNYSPAQMDIFREVAPLSVVQSPYNIFEREIEKDVLPYAEKHKLVQLAYGPLCRGLLTGKMTADKTFPDTDLRASDPKFQKEHFKDYLAAVDDLKAIADRHGKSLMVLAIRWVLDQGPTIALWGARKPEQIDGVGDVFGWHLSEQDKKDIDTILKRHVPTPIAPSFMAPPARKA